MTITVDLATEDVRTGTTSPRTFSHAGAASGVRGVVLMLMHGASAADHVSAASYGGVALSRQVRTTDTATEPGAAEIWFLGTGIPQGTQTVSYTPGSTTDDIHAICVTVLGDADTQVIDTDSVSADGSGGTLANPSRTLQNSSKIGTSAMAFAAMYSGLTAQTSITAGSNCTKIGSSELSGNFTSTGLRQTTAQTGTGDFTIAATSSADDCAFVAVVVAEMQGASPAVGAVRLDGQAPSIGQTWSAEPTVGAVVIVGQQPTVQSGVSYTITPSVGTVRLDGQTPTARLVDSWIARIQGVETWGLRYQIGGTDYSPSVGTVRTVGQQPTVTSDSGVTVTPSVGTVVLTGQQPAIGQTWSAAPTVGAVAVVGQQPTLTVSLSATPSVGAVRVDGQQPSIGQTWSVAPSVGAVRLDGQQPAVSAGDGKTVQPSVGTFRFVGNIPALAQTWSVDPAAGAVRTEGQQPAVTATDHQTVAPSVGTLRLDGQQPFLTQAGDALVQPYAGTLRITGLIPEIVVPGLGVPEQPSGGYGWRNLAASERQRRIREEIEDERERQALADRLEAELRREGVLADKEAERIKLAALANQYGSDVPNRVQRALRYAERAETELAVQLALREFSRLQEEEEVAVLMALALD